MRCPECRTDFHVQPDEVQNYWVADDDPDTRDAFGVAIQLCPSCSQMLVIYRLGTGMKAGSGPLMLAEIREQRVVYPSETNDQVADEIPDDYKRDLAEVRIALDYSPKASAALSRRLLQRVLRERLNIRRKDLSLEIQAFVDSSGAPSYLTGAVDAIRQVGNFAAHPLKYTNSSEIVDVEEGEAEWLSEVLDSLFDFVFVQPSKLEARRAALNEKLRDLGKPELRSP
jgi:hypothetical protein